MKNTKSLHAHCSSACTCSCGILRCHCCATCVYPSCQFPIWPPWILVHFRKQMTFTMTNTNTEYTKAGHFLEAAKKAWESRRTGRGPFLITHPTSVQTLLLPQHSWLLNSKKDSKQVKKMKSPASHHFYKKGIWLGIIDSLKSISEWVSYWQG